ncbi:MAG: SUMF1/EgtB/PvdO family nonheme iron enzyme [Bacteroidales bacterium]|nr:SUMF1/EgtB/PvdO family nonheme iron enzyme [Bacteroidales bacterium]
MKNLKTVSFFVLVTILLAGCSSYTSETTGWNYNDSKWGGFEVSQNTEQMTGYGLVFIEGGSFQMGRVSDDTRYQWNNTQHTVTVSSFYMDETEVRNVDYREYIYWLNRAYGSEYPEYVRNAYPDTNAWREKLRYAEPMVEYYFQTPNYQDYPVVGVSWEQASAYCIWRSNRVNERIAIDAGILPLDFTDLRGESAFQTDVYFAGLYRGETKQEMENLDPAAGGEPRRVNKADGIFLPNYRLPTEAEWEFAALGLVGTMIDGRIVEHRVYPWNGQSVRSAEKDYYGQFLANFKRSRGDNMGVAGDLNDGYVYTAPVRWYFPNDYGLYNMAGNVSEWCMDVYRKQTQPLDGEEVNPFRGNIYKTYTIVDEEILINDTSGGIVYRNVDEDLNRRNYRQADNVNYLDGDYASTIFDPQTNQNLVNWSGSSVDEEEAVEEGSADYLSNPDSVTNMMYRRNSTDKNSITSMLNNKVRVVKGGSWNDRIYWMQPGTRRYYDQDKSTAWIGFRCAMDRLGAQKIEKK